MFRRKQPKLATPVATATATTCSRGHDLTEPKNVHVDREGKKHCRACWAEHGPESA